MRRKRLTVLTVIILSFVMVFASGCGKTIDRTITNTVDREIAAEPDSMSVADIELTKGESKTIAVTFTPSDAYSKYAFSVPVTRQSEISIKNGVVTALRAAATPVTVTCYTLDEKLVAEFSVKVNGYYDPTDGAIYAFNRMGSFDYPTPATSLDVAATGWNISKNWNENVNTFTLSHYDAEEELRDPGGTRWAPRYSHPAVQSNNVKIFDTFEFDYTFSHTLTNVPAGKWYFSVYMEGNNVEVTWKLTGLEDNIFPVASTASWYYMVVDLAEPTTLDFSMRFVGETTDPDDDKSSPWIFFDSIRAVNELNIEYDEDTPAEVVTNNYTNYVVDGNFGAAEANAPIADMTDYVWKVGNEHRNNSQDLTNAQLAVVTSDTNFAIDPNGKSLKYKDVTRAANKFSLYQELSGLPHNFYTFTLYAMGNPDNTARQNEYFRMFVTYTDLAGNEQTVYQNISTRSYHEGYIENTMSGIEITDGKAKIGIDFVRPGWGNTTDEWFQLDDISFVASNELAEEEIDIFNTYGLTNILPVAADLSDAANLGDTGWTAGASEVASAALDTTGTNGLIGDNALAVEFTAAGTLELTQTIAGLTADTNYLLSAHIKSSGNFTGTVSANGQNGTTVTNSADYMQSYTEFTVSGTSAELKITLVADGAVTVYLDWLYVADTTVNIAVDDVVDADNFYVGDVLTPYVQFIPSSKSTECDFVITSGSDFIDITDGVMTALAAGTATIKVTDPVSSAETTFTVVVKDRPLLESITVSDRTMAVDSLMSTKLLIVTKTPSVAIMGDVSYELAEGSEQYVTLIGTRITAVAAGEATVIAKTTDAEGTEVKTTFKITVLTVQQGNSNRMITRFNSSAKNSDNFTDGGWTVAANSIAGGTTAFTPAGVFDPTSTIWAADGAVVYDFKLTQKFTNLAAGTYELSITTEIAFNGTTLTAGLNEATQLYTNSNSATSQTTTVTAVVENGGDLEIWFSITGTVSASNRSVWGNGVTAISIAKTA